MRSKIYTDGRTGRSRNKETGSRGRASRSKKGERERKEGKKRKNKKKRTFLLSLRAMKTAKGKVTLRQTDRLHRKEQKEENNREKGKAIIVGD